MRTNKLLDFKPARVRRRAMAMFLGSIVLLLVLLWFGWLAISWFVQDRYQKQLTNQVELLSSVIDNWGPKPEPQDENAPEPEPDKARGKGGYDPCPSPAAKALCEMIRQAHYEYEGKASWPLLPANPSTGYFFLFNDHLDGIAHGSEKKYEAPSEDIQKYKTFNSIQELHNIAEKGAAEKGVETIRCTNYAWEPKSEYEQESKLDCVKQINTTLIPETPRTLNPKHLFFLGTGMLQSEINSRKIKIFTIVSALIRALYVSMLLLFHSYRRDMEGIQWRILDSLAAGVLITRKDKTGDREKILVVNHELKHLYGLQTEASGTKGLEHKGLERIIPKEQEKNRKPDPDLESQRTFLDYTFTLERTGTGIPARWAIAAGTRRPDRGVP